MGRWIVLAFGVLAVCGGVGACVDTPAHPPVVVAMDGTTFRPPEVTVTVGQTVTWINKDPFPHNVVSGAASFASQAVEPGQEWRFTPQSSGRFPYACTLHPGMSGTLIVQAR